MWCKVSVSQRSAQFVGPPQIETLDLELARSTKYFQHQRLVSMRHRHIKSVNVLSSFQLQMMRN
jgi:hypothetical protein